MGWQGLVDRVALGLAVVTAAAACVTAGPVGVASAASSGGPSVSGGDPPVVGAQLTETGAVDPEWVSCTAGGTPVGGGVLGGGSTYQLVLGDAGGYVCAQDALLGSTSAPVGPVEGLPAGAEPVLSATGGVAQGQTLRVTSGGWGPGASVSDAWEDCDASGGACAPVASRATGPAYTVTRSDAGHVIEALETATASDGAHSSAVTAPTGVVTATAPIDLGAPSVSGTAKVGDRLTAVPGSWSNEPTSYAYAWYRCSPGSCTAIRGATGATYTPTSADAGSSLEVLVTASVLGSAGQGYPSAPTRTVTGGRAPSGHHRSRRRRHRTAPHLAATMLWTFRYSPISTQVLQFDVEAAPLGARIIESCAGRGCPFTRSIRTVTRPRHCRGRHVRRCPVPGVIDLQSAFRTRHLRAGATLTVTVTRRGEIGKYYRFRMRARRQPAVRIACLAPGGMSPGRGCHGD